MIDLVFERSQPVEVGLPASAVVGPLDPGNDRDPQLLGGGPGFLTRTALRHPRRFVGPDWHESRFGSGRHSAIMQERPCMDGWGGGWEVVQLSLEDLDWYQRHRAGAGPQDRSLAGYR